jgi:DNA-binding FadR family transcriptional regulator
MSGNRVLDLLVRGLRTLPRRGPRWRRAPAHEHRAIGEAILHGDEGEMMRRHLEQLAEAQLAIVLTLRDDRVTWHGQDTPGGDRALTPRDNCLTYA